MRTTTHWDLIVKQDKEINEILHLHLHILYYFIQLHIQIYAFFKQNNRNINLVNCPVYCATN